VKSYYEYFINGSPDQQLDMIVSIVSILGIIFTVTTIIIALKSLKSGIGQLKEMKIQRIHSQEPELYLEPIDLKVDYHNQNILFDSPWIYEDNEITKNDLLKLKFVNIGNGVAKNIKIRIFFEEEYLSQIIESHTSNIFNTRLLETDYGYTFFQYEHDAGDNGFSGTNYDINEEFFYFFNYVMPNNNIEIPLNYKIFKILNMHLFLNESNSFEEQTMYYPRFKLELSYQDSFNNNYSKELDLFLSVNSKNLSFEENNGIKIFFQLQTINKLPIKEIHD